MGNSFTGQIFTGEFSGVDSVGTVRKVVSKYYLYNRMNLGYHKKNPNVNKNHVMVVGIVCNTANSS